MFDSVLRRSSAPTSKFGFRAALSILSHAIVLGGLVWFTTKKKVEVTDAPEVTFFSPTGKGKPGPPPLQKGDPLSTERVVATEPVKTEKFVKNTNKNTSGKSSSAKKSNPYGDDKGPEMGGTPDGAKGGDPDAGSGTATATATVTAPPPPPPPPPQNMVIPFGPGMDRPTKIGGPEPAYTREAREARVEGKMLVQCVVTASGSLQNCKVLKSLPFMDQSVLSALAQQRWSPAKVNGEPVSVLFTIPFSFKLKD